MIRSPISSLALRRARISSMAIPKSNTATSRAIIAHPRRQSSFYHGGDAHVTFAPIRSDYLFERPPAVPGAATAMEGGGEYTAGLVTASSAAAMHQFDSPHHAAAASASASGNGASAAGSAAVAGGAGSAWLAYESAEFTPLEEVLLDFTAWMIALAVCWQPNNGSDDLEQNSDDDDNDDYGRNVRENHMIKKRRRDNQQQQQQQQQHILEASSADPERSSDNEDGISGKEETEEAQAEYDDEEDVNSDVQD